MNRPLSRSRTELILNHQLAGRAFGPETTLAEMKRVEQQCKRTCNDEDDDNDDDSPGGKTLFHEIGEYLAPRLDEYLRVRAEHDTAAPERDRRWEGWAESQRGDRPDQPDPGLDPSLNLKSPPLKSSLNVNHASSAGTTPAGFAAFNKPGSNVHRVDGGAAAAGAAGLAATVAGGVAAKLGGAWNLLTGAGAGIGKVAPSLWRGGFGGAASGF